MPAYPHSKSSPAHLPLVTRYKSPAAATTPAATPRPCYLLGQRFQQQASPGRARLPAGVALEGQRSPSTEGEEHKEGSAVAQVGPGRLPSHAIVTQHCGVAHPGRVMLPELVDHDRHPGVPAGGKGWEAAVQEEQVAIILHRRQAGWPGAAPARLCRAFELQALDDHQDHLKVRGDGPQLAIQLDQTLFHNRSSILPSVLTRRCALLPVPPNTPTRPYTPHAPEEVDVREPAPPGRDLVKGDEEPRKEQQHGHIQRQHRVGSVHVGAGSSNEVGQRCRATGTPGKPTDKGVGCCWGWGRGGSCVGSMGVKEEQKAMTTCRW